MTESATSFEHGPATPRLAPEHDHPHDDDAPQDEPSGIRKVVTSLPVDHSGTTVYVKAWRLPETAKHPIVIVHDLGEQTELYRETAHALVRAGHSAYCFDLRGHGRSGRRLGHVQSFKTLVKDLLQVAAWVRHLERGQAPVLIGQGLGALVVMDFLKSHASYAQAAVLGAPLLSLATRLGAGKRLLIMLLAEAMPTLRLPVALSARFTRSTRERLPMSACFTAELLTALKRYEGRFIDYKGELLVLCPEQDAVCAYDGLKGLLARDPRENVRLVALDGAEHSLFTGDAATRARTIDLILPWLEETGCRSRD